jgi:alkylation response protein AidB-like acyl-CoA dehydrogenase
LHAASDLQYLESARRLSALARECADEAERNRSLPKRLTEAMALAGLYRVAAPCDVGGGETHPFTQIRVIEALSEADGAAGWNLMIGIEATGFLGAALEPDVARELFSDPALVVAGALNPLGRAEPVAGGFRVSGRWPFASGCQQSHYFWGQCVEMHGTERVRDDRGQVVLREAVVPAESFEVLDTWHVSGLRGSGSHDVEVRDVFIPTRRMTEVSRRPPHAHGTLFRLPAGSRLAYNKVGVATGIARAAIDDFVALASQKTPRASSASLRERSDAQRAVAEAEASLRSARAFVFEAVEEMWDVIDAGGTATARQRALVQLACSHAASAAVDAVGRVHAAAGTTVNQLGQPLERRFRDVQVVRQHITVSPQWVESAGRVLLGLESRSPLIG